MIGSLSNQMVESLLETLPVEFSVLDAQDTVVAWNKHTTRIFKRPEAALGRNVRQCHPQKSLAKVEQILVEMKQGKRDQATFWIDLPIGPNKENHKIFIQYYALRDNHKKYLGCLEVTQDITPLQQITGEQRLLD